MKIKRGLDPAIDTLNGIRQFLYIRLQHLRSCRDDGPHDMHDTNDAAIDGAIAELEHILKEVDQRILMHNARRTIEEAPQLFEKVINELVEGVVDAVMKDIEQRLRAKTDMKNLNKRTTEE